MIKQFCRFEAEIKYDGETKSPVFDYDVDFNCIIANDKFQVFVASDNSKIDELKSKYSYIETIDVEVPDVNLEGNISNNP